MRGSPVVQKPAFRSFLTNQENASVHGLTKLAYSLLYAVLDAIIVIL